MGEDVIGGCGITAGIIKPTQYHSKNYSCPYCPYHTYKISNIQTHIRTHTGEKPFLCPFCSLSFAQSSSLKRHIRIHTGEKPYNCQLCSFKAARSSSLKQHMQSHSENNIADLHQTPH